MADSTTNLDLITASQSGKETTADELYDAASPAVLFGRRATTCAGLTWGYYGGPLSVAGVPTPIANGTIALTASATNYLYSTSAGVVTKATSAPSGWPGPLAASAIALYAVVTDSSTATSWTDYRTSTVGGGALPSGTPTGTGFVHVTGGVQDGAAVTVDLSGAHVTGTLAAARMPALTGDITTSAGAVATTLATSGVTAATYGDSTHVAQVTFDAKGRATSATSVAITGAAPTGSAGGDLTGTFPNPTITTDAVTTTKILDDNVTNAKLANMATGTIKYRRTAGTGDPEDSTLANLKSDLGLTGTNSGDQTITLTSDVTGTGTGSFATTIAAGAVTLAKMANVATQRIFGRKTASTGVPEALTADQALTVLTQVQTIAFSATPSIDVSAAVVSDITLTGNVTSCTLTGGVDGRSYQLRIIQDGTGGRTFAFDSGVRFGTDITSFTASTGASKVDYVTVRYNGAASKYDFVSYVRGF